MRALTAAEIEGLVARCYEHHDHLWDMNEAGDYSLGNGVDFADTVDLALHINGDITDAALVDSYIAYLLR